MKRYGLLLALVVALAACSKVNVENYGKIKVGMSYEEVRAILGDPTRCDDVAGFRGCQWGDEKSNITVQMVGDNVVMRSAKNLK
ncbi:MAG TPA: hypothetical protein VJM53_11245 [Burkholderiales bacterium]|jgi:hypothetical protein|nr:hypothetical protein [Burkholderiales bacterium]